MIKFSVSAPPKNQKGHFAIVTVDHKKILHPHLLPTLIKKMPAKSQTAFFKQNSPIHTESDAKYSFINIKGKTAEDYRLAFARFAQNLPSIDGKLYICIKNLTDKNCDASTVITAITEGISLAIYRFARHRKKNEFKVKTHINFVTDESLAPLKKALTRALNSCESINIARDFVNEAPNILNSETYAKQVQADVKKNLPGVKVKILGKQGLVKEKMGLFLAVNQGSNFAPQLVHLTYTPKKVTKKTRHIALVGKGLTFDTGGTNLKPSAFIAGMKFDMGGSATVYGAFRSAVKNDSPHKITCILGITDNAIGPKAMLPDAIYTARNGKTVEIGNTDAEGRLVLADCLDYVCDLKPDFIIDAATLTGACLVALGKEIAGLMSNHDDFCNQLIGHAQENDEKIWKLPIFDEHREAMRKSPVADLTNSGPDRFGGTSRAGAFLEEFIKNDIPWCHLDIAGIASSQKHLPYCAGSDASGLMVRTIASFLCSA